MPSLTNCPRCNAQIVMYGWGFRCSMCDYDVPQWVEDIANGRDLPGISDSPALVKP